MWFKNLMGFDEISYETVQKNIIIKGNKLTSKINNKTYQFGELETPTLKDLRKRAPKLDSFNESAAISQYVGDVQILHQKSVNKNAIFQVASQFNLLEMAGPNNTPEMGVDIYSYDHTQGPACAISCGAGTIYRNYFASVNGRKGQTSDNQINCLELIEKEINPTGEFWEMVNGYALLSKDSLDDVNFYLENIDDYQRERLKDKLKVGVQWETEVTIGEEPQLVSQVFCSALPVSYTSIDGAHWEGLANVILEATYEATLYAALINLQKTGSNLVYLTLVGGGAFGNHMTWIVYSLLNVLKKFKNTPLDIRIVSHEYPNEIVNEMIKRVWE